MLIFYYLALLTDVYFYQWHFKFLRSTKMITGTKANHHKLHIQHIKRGKHFKTTLNALFSLEC